MKTKDWFKMGFGLTLGITLANGLMDVVRGKVLHIEIKKEKVKEENHD